MQALLLDRYATNRNDLLGEFYAPCLNRASRYDRAVGYFRSSIVLLAVRPIAGFALAGGRMRLICSPQLTEQDIEAIATGYEWRRSVKEALLRTLESALRDDAGRPAVEFLATLVAMGSLEIRIALRPETMGLFHDKVGIFQDEDGHSVSFTGSSNETFSGWDMYGNHESFDVFRSWTPDAPRVKAHENYFESLWEGREPGLEVLPFPEVARERLVAVANPAGVEGAYQRLAKSKVVHGRTPQVHQLEVIQDWERHGYRGIVAHATGAGKTITGLTAVRQWISTKGPAIITVPTTVLLEQWRGEVAQELGEDTRILVVGAGHDGWQRPNVIEAFTSSGDQQRLVLGTLQTISDSRFVDRVRAGEHLLMVSDEVHTTGSPHHMNLYRIDAGGRLGLSATPERFGDRDGTAAMFAYFGPVLMPPFTIADGIAAGRLCPYTYHVHIADLNEAELNSWRLLTKDLQLEIARSHGTARDSNPPMSERAKFLAIKRADILKGAEAKPQVALNVIQAAYRAGQRWLIYCDDRDQLDKVVNKFQGAGYDVNSYHSSMVGDPAATLEYFSLAGGLLVAIKCLDEGVDIPAADHALILASSKNPREFIQRRGRVLRMTADKLQADVHDVLVRPPAGDVEPPDLAIVRGELARALVFARDASNEAVGFELAALAIEVGIDVDELAPGGVEDEETG